MRDISPRKIKDLGKREKKIEELSSNISKGRELDSLSRRHNTVVNIF